MMRVLLVEDDAVFRAHLKHVLRAMQGTTVVMEASTQAEASAWLRQHPAQWDLALIDLFLAHGNGFRVLRDCHRILDHQRAVVLTNYNQGPVSEYARMAGADAFFDKSFDMEGLVDYCLAHNRYCAGLQTA